jgi:hypothetical protein
MAVMHRRMVPAAVVAAMFVTLAACGGPTPKSATTTTHAATTTTAQVIASSTVTLNGKAYPVPTEVPGTPIKPFSDSGQQMVLTVSGFLPSQLFSATGQPVVVTNLTPKRVTITLVSTGLSAPSHSLAPGASFSYTPTGLAYGYASSTGRHSVVNVGAFTGPS